MAWITHVKDSMVSRVKAKYRSLDGLFLRWLWCKLVVQQTLALKTRSNCFHRGVGGMPLHWKAVVFFIVFLPKLALCHYAPRSEHGWVFWSVLLRRNLQIHQLARWQSLLVLWWLFLIFFWEQRYFLCIYTLMDQMNPKKDNKSSSL